MCVCERERMKKGKWDPNEKENETIYQINETVLLKAMSDLMIMMPISGRERGEEGGSGWKIQLMLSSSRYVKTSVLRFPIS